MQKAQSAFEYMTMLGIALIILMGLVAFSYQWTIASKESMQIRAAENAVYKVVEAADLVYAQGSPAKNSVLVQIPERVEFVSIGNNSITIRVNSTAGYSDITASTKGNITGFMPAHRGYYWITVQSFGEYVNVSYQEQG